MSKFKVGDSVVEKDSGKVYTIREVEEYTDGHFEYIMKELLREYHFVDEDIELAKSKKTFTIQEVLTEDNVGKRFEFNGYEYEVKGSFSTLRLEDDNGDLIDEFASLINILNGTFTLIEEAKPFTQEIDFKEAFKRLCDGEEVKFEDTTKNEEDSEIFKLFYGNGLAWKDVDGSFHRCRVDLSILNEYNKYYKK